MAKALTLALTRLAFPAPLEALRIFVVCCCGLALAGARLGL